MESDKRNIVWFSCGIASAVTAYLAVKEGLNPEVVYCNTMMSENPDNARFFSDVEKWIDKRIKIISSEKYESIDDVFMKTRYMAGISGARCTTEMKKIPRFEFQRADDVHYFGFTINEHKRIINFKKNNPELESRFLLTYYGLTKEDCHSMLPKWIKKPIMYELGFNNNNCIGCVKAQSPKYWNLVRINFPEVFKRRCEQSRLLKVRLVKIGKKRIYLDELLSDDMRDYNEQIECGVVCQTKLKT